MLREAIENKKVLLSLTKKTAWLYQITNKVNNGINITQNTYNQCLTSSTECTHIHNIQLKIQNTFSTNTIISFDVDLVKFVTVTSEDAP